MDGPVISSLFRAVLSHRLPVDGPNGEVLVAEATVSGKKKDAVIACALEACRLLDMHGMLHASKHGTVSTIPMSSMLPNMVQWAPYQCQAGLHQSYLL